MNKVEAQERMDFLNNELHKHNHQYFILNNPTISDSKYDKMMSELATLETEFNIINSGSPTTRIGSPLFSNKFKKIKHSTPMLSLDKAFTIEEFNIFDNRIINILGF